jgi:hypothetical protein
LKGEEKTDLKYEVATTLMIRKSTAGIAENINASG